MNAFTYSVAVNLLVKEIYKLTAPIIITQQYTLVNTGSPINTSIVNNNELFIKINLCPEDLLVALSENKKSSIYIIVYI